MTPAQKIKKIEKEIEELLLDLAGYGYSRKETIVDLEKEDSDCIWEVKKRYIELKAKLSILKELEAEDKRKVEEELVFLKRIVQYRDTKDRNDKERFNLINQRIKIFSPQEDKIIESKIQFIKNDIVSLTRLAKKIDEGKC